VRVAANLILCKLAVSIGRVSFFSVAIYYDC